MKSMLATLVMVCVSSLSLMGCATRSDLARVEEKADKAYAEALLAKDCCATQNIRMNEKLNEMFKKSQYK